MERHFIPAEKFAPYVHAGNAHGLLDGVLHELGRSRPQGEAPIDTRSYRQLAKAAIETLSKDKEKPFGEISGSIQVIAESEIKASGKDSADSLVFRKYLAESLASSLEFPGDGRYLPYFGASLNSVLARELDVPFSDAQWDRIAVAMYQRPGVMREVLGMPASGKGAPPEKLRPLVKRLVTQMETEMAALEKSDPGERAFRIVALARAARLDPAVLSREKVVEWAKTIPERTAESHYYIPQIISGVFFEEK